MTPHRAQPPRPNVVVERSFAPFRASVYCHVPSDVEIDPGRLAERNDSADRWNEPGQPTVYLALDVGVALAEFARHAAPGDRRRLVRFDAALDAVADLRPGTPASNAPSRDSGRRGDREHDPAPGPPDHGLVDVSDRDAARRVAARFRAEPGCCGLLVPSLAFPDDPARGNLVVFAERAGPPETWLANLVVVGSVTLQDERDRWRATRTHGADTDARTP